MIGSGGGALTCDWIGGGGGALTHHCSFVGFDCVLSSFVSSFG